MKMSIFHHPQLDEYFFQFTDLKSLISLLQVNRYYRDLIRIILFYLRQERSLTKIFVNECGHGTLETVQWVYDRHYEITIIPFKWRAKINLHANKDQALRRACEHGKLEIVQYLLNKGEESGKPFSLDHDWMVWSDVANTFIRPTPFRISLLYGHFDLALWLHHRKMEVDPSFDLTQYHREAYILICRQGRLRDVQWLFDLKIPPSELSMICFNQACYFGYLDIARYLYGLGIISLQDPDFRKIIAKTCEQGQWKMAKWLISLVDND